MVVLDRLINRPPVNLDFEDFDKVPSLAKPNKEIGIKQMLKLHMAGEPLPACGTNLFYDKEPTLDKSLMNQIDLDLTDLDKAREELFFRQQAIAQGVMNYEKALEDREAFEKTEKFRKRYEQYFERKFDESEKNAKKD